MSINPDNQNLREAAPLESRIAEPKYLLQARAMVKQLCVTYDKDETPMLTALDIVSECFRRATITSPAHLEYKERKKVEKEMERLSLELFRTKEKLEAVLAKPAPKPQTITVPAQPSQKNKGLRKQVVELQGENAQLRNWLKTQPSDPLAKKLSDALGEAGSLRQRVKELEDQVVKPEHVLLPNGNRFPIEKVLRRFKTIAGREEKTLEERLAWIVQNITNYEMLLRGEEVPDREKEPA